VHGVAEVAFVKQQRVVAFEALRESSGHSGVAMGAKTRSLLTRTHFVPH